MGRRDGWPLLALVGALILLPSFPAAAQTRLSADELFKRYVGGDQAAVVAAIAAERDGRPIIRDVARRVTSWVRNGWGTPEIRFTVATFLLDVAGARLESDWQLVRYFVETGCRLLDPLPETSERMRLWHLAASAAAQGALDERFLFPPRNRGDDESIDHLAHARAKFPDQPQWKLAAVVVAAFQEADQFWPRDKRVPTDEELLAAGITGQAALTMRRSRRRALADFTALASDPIVGPEARLRAGFMAFQLYDDERALVELDAAAGSPDPFIAYNAQLLAAMVYQRRDDAAAAEGRLRRALDAVPLGQAALQLLIGQLYLSNRQAEAHDLMESWTNARVRPTDPWRQFGYGDFRSFGETMARLRRLVLP